MRGGSFFLRLLAIVSLLLWSFSAYDMVATLGNDRNYLKDFSPEMIAWIQGFPLWRKLLWGASIACAIIGNILLLMQRKSAVLPLIMAFLFMLAGFLVHDLLMADGVRYYGQQGLVASFILILFAASVAFYALFARRAGQLH